MKWTLRFFALLDIMCAYILFDQAKSQYLSFAKNETLTSLEFFSRGLFLLGWASLFISAILLLIPKRAGIIVYYFQIPVRFIFFIFSFGFISLATYVITWNVFLQFLTPLIIFLEFLRIYFSVKIQKRMF